MNRADNYPSPNSSQRGRLVGGLSAAGSSRVVGYHKKFISEVPLLDIVNFCIALARESFFVVRYDNRDAGESTSCSPGERNDDVHDLVEDGITLLDGYKIDACTIFSLSLGGMIAQLVAIRYPARVTSLILLSPSIWDETPDLPQISEKAPNYHRTAESLDWCCEECYGRSTEMSIPA